MRKLSRDFLGNTLVAIPLLLGVTHAAQAQDLNTFAVIAGQSLTNTGPTTIIGNIALSPGASYTGSGSVTQTGTTFIADAIAARVQDDLSTLYPILAARPTSTGGDLTGQDLGGMTLMPGVYNFDSSAGLAAGQTLTLDAGGNPAAVFIFNIGSTLIAETGSKVVLTNGAQGGNVFYRVGSSATLNTTADMAGQIVALTSVTLNTAAKLSCGAAFARNGSVTLDTNTVQVCVLAGPGFDTIVDNPTLTPAEKAVSKALSDFVAGGGVLPIGFAILAATQTPAELARNLAQMSGEVATGIGPTGLQSVDDFLATVMASAPRPGVLASPDSGLPVGLVQEQINTPYSAKYGSTPMAAVAPLAFAPTMADLAHPWSVWASGYGSRDVTEGDASRGEHERTSQNRGIAVGLNYAVSAATDFGVALSWSDSDFTLADGFGSGDSETMFVALRGRTGSDRGYLSGALAYGRSDITTERNVTIAGLDRLVRDTQADTLAAHVEAGYHMGVFTPFVGLHAAAMRVEGSSERAVAGTSTYALRYDTQTTRSLRSELGVDVQLPVAPLRGGTAAVGLRAAWAHEFADYNPSTSSFATVPGATFQTTGARADRDSLILAVNASLVSTKGFYVNGGLNTEISKNARDFGGSVTVGYRW